MGYLLVRTVGMFKTKTHLPELIKDVQNGEELCITKSGKKVAFIIPVDKYYENKNNVTMEELLKFKKSYPLGSNDEIIEMKNMGKK